MGGRHSLPFTMKYLIRLVFAGCLWGGTLLANLAAQDAAAELSAEALEAELLGAAREPVDDFPGLVERARAAGANEAVIAQASVFVALNQGKLDEAFGLIPQLEATAEQAEYGPAQPFGTARQLKGFIAAMRALEAYQSGQPEVFEPHAAKAFVDAPDFVEAFGLLRIMSEIRQAEATEAAMARIRVPMDLKVASVEGETKTLAEWTSGHQAILLDFWASWCAPCIQLMPELRAKAAALPEQGVFVAGLNTDEGDAVSLAKKVRQERGMQSVPWLIEPEGSPLSSLLGVDSIPRMLLIDPEGKVLYNGHPSDPSLKAALAKLDVVL